MAFAPYLALTKVDDELCVGYVKNNDLSVTSFSPLDSGASNLVRCMKKVEDVRVLHAVAGEHLIDRFQNEQQCLHPLDCDSSKFVGSIGYPW
ncbi:MAG: hypothetical protein G8345_04205 [Magnetococcales bacterium]|nr:hypothetical protein [Magnetococcales bacterium]NGZ26074.1 hypothetical protein [Magnetococcales bacterium]